MQDRSCYKLTQEGERLFRMQKYEKGNFFFIIICK